MPARPPARLITTRLAPIREFVTSGSAGGAMLIMAALVAIVWANAPALQGGDAYAALLHWAPPPPLHLPLHIWVNDALMVVFFLMVGLELRREITIGELSSLDRLATPAIAALGGMAAPALVFLAFNHGNPTAMRGWAVPVATDIAFALAVARLLGAGVPLALKVFLAALAIIDDLGAILVIAVFYTAGLDYLAIAAAALVWLALLGLNRAGIRALWPYLLGGVVLWALVFRSGIHATIAGVALAFVVPMSPRSGKGPGSASGATPSPAARLEHALSPWVAFAILPVFGLVNAGLRFDTLPHGAWADPLALGIGIGLLLGKQLGVFGAVLAATRMGIARMPAGVTLPQLYGASILCGIGFTMSLFIGDLAFRTSPRGDEAKLAVFIGSLLSAVAGLCVLFWFRHRPHRSTRH